MSKPLVAYFRVALASRVAGLGIDAQRAAVARFATAEGYEVVGESSRSRPARARTQ